MMFGIMYWGQDIVFWICVHRFSQFSRYVVISPNMESLVITYTVKPLDVAEN